MMKSKWTQFFIALFFGFSIAYYFIGREIPDQQTSAGLSIPNLEFFDQKGKLQKTLSDYKGKTVLVSFWASWCEPCREELPELVKLKDQLAEENFEVVLINADDDQEEGASFLKDLKVNFDKIHSYYDLEFKNAQKLRVDSLPSSFLINSSGKEVFSTAGYMNWLDDHAIKMIKEELKN